VKYRKKPVVIEARQWLPGNPLHAGEVAGWLLVHGAQFTHETREDGPAPMGDRTPLMIQTLEGEMRADPGDWIIQGVKGEFYPCKPDIFDATYEPAEPQEEPSP